MAAVIAAIGFQGSVLAQANPLPWDGLVEPAEYVTFEVDDSGWTLYPVITADDVFVGFFGYLPDEFVVGDNVSLLWLIPDNSDGTWSMYGWSHTEIKVVSNYLDNLTSTEDVLADTGLGIVVGVTGSITSPKSMPFGIAEDDPLAPIMEATQDPEIADALITVGAAGAPNLTRATNIQPVDGACVYADENVSHLDSDLAYQARVVQEVMIVWLSEGILDSLELTGWDVEENVLENCGGGCTPMDNTIWGPWSDWNCQEGPSVTPQGQCHFAFCERTRTGRRVIITSDCVFTNTPVSATEQNPDVTVPMVDGECPSYPS